MDISKLKLFIALAETQHFNRAASLCHVSTSTLSRNIQQLEQQLKNALFTRNSRSVVLTPQGETFLHYAREALQQWDALQNSMQSGAQELQGSISIYCSVTASYSFLYDILMDFRRQHPKIAIRLHTGDPALALDRIKRGQEDIAITAKLNTMPGGIRFKRITTSPLVLITPLNHDFTETHTAQTSIEDPEFWNNIPLIISEQGIAREGINRWFKHHNISPNIYAQVGGNEAIVSMVGLGFGIGFVPKIVVDNSPLTDRIRLFEHQINIPDYEVGVCMLEKRLKNPIIEAFWSQI